MITPAEQEEVGYYFLRQIRGRGLSTGRTRRGESSLSARFPLRSNGTAQLLPPALRLLSSSRCFCQSRLLAHGFHPDLCRLTWMARRSPSRKPGPWCSEKEGHAALFSKRMRDASARLLRDHAVISERWPSPLLDD
ncbi:hypothetical protein KOW79_000816 [Hemibagrus wyckioides]|uniref:Uncharacterized protein n=1 Tax=Hemibagrus wyckioides TaxID=337641 RepID=A0A9D3SYZ7_9TELE|nr:hypothetical protein KOW79_000816 [Hemibagrus wyckioides]